MDSGLGLLAEDNSKEFFDNYEDIDVTSPYRDIDYDMNNSVYFVKWKNKTYREANLLKNKNKFHFVFKKKNENN